MPRLDRDAVPECFELPDGAWDGALAVAAGEVLCPQFLICRLVPQDVVRNLQHLMTHRNDGFLVPAMSFDAAIGRLERRAVRTSGGQGTPNITVASFMPASSRTRYNRLTSCVRSSICFLR